MLDPINSRMESIDYSVQFANIQRVVENIPEPWKTELAEAASDLQELIQEDLGDIRQMACAESTKLQEAQDSIKRTSSSWHLID
jgi:hypothetical protein